MRLAIVAFAVVVGLAVAPVHAEQRADARKVELDRLLLTLKSAADEPAAGRIEARIRALWVKQGSPAAVLLLTRGDRDLQDNLGREALDDFDAVLTLEPDYAEGFSHRAAARAALGDYQGALADIGEALKREPRHFAALQNLSHLAEQRGDWKGSLAAWQKALDIDPHMPGGAARLKLLQDKVYGAPA